MKPLLSILLIVIPPILSSAEDLVKIKALSEAVIPFEATWKVRTTKTPPSIETPPPSTVTTKKVKAQFISRKLFKASERLADGKTEHYDWRSSYVDDILEEYVPVIALNTYLKWYDRQVVGVGTDENILICQSVSEARFFGKMKLEFERGDPLKLKKALFFQYDLQGQAVPERSLEFEYDKDAGNTQFGTVFPIYTKVTLWEGTPTPSEVREIWLEVATEIDKEWKPRPKGKFLTGKLKPKL